VSLNPSGSGHESPAPANRYSVSRTVDDAMPSRRAISRVATLPENFRRTISRTSRIGTLSAEANKNAGCQRPFPDAIASINAAQH